MGHQFLSIRGLQLMEFTVLEWHALTTCVVLQIPMDSINIIKFKLFLSHSMKQQPIHSHFGQKVQLTILLLSSTTEWSWKTQSNTSSQFLHSGVNLPCQNSTFQRQPIIISVFWSLLQIQLFGLIIFVYLPLKCPLQLNEMSMIFGSISIKMFNCDVKNSINFLCVNSS